MTPHATPSVLAAETLALLALLSPPAALCQTPESTPAAELETRLVERVDDFQESSGIPAVGAAVIQPGRPVAIAVAGHRTANREVPVTEDDLWHLGSISKSFTATLVARLVEKPTPLDVGGSGDTLDWSTPLGLVLPAAVDTPFEEVPLRFFLGHRSGLIANPPMSRFQGRDTTTPIREQRDGIVAELLATAPASEPGTEMLYSNAGYIVVGTALEHLLDASWEELVSREVFEPLGLGSAGFGPPGSVASVDQPRGHTGASNDALTPVPPTPIADNPSFLGPAGTIHMSLEDLAAYVRAHLEGELGTDGILRAETFHTLHTPLEGQTYALGWIRFADGNGPAAIVPGDLWMHNGSNTIWYAIVFFAPEEEVAVAVTTNAGLHNAQSVNRFAIRLLQDFGASAGAEAEQE